MFWSAWIRFREEKKGDYDQVNKFIVSPGSPDDSGGPGPRVFWAGPLPAPMKLEKIVFDERWSFQGALLLDSSLREVLSSWGASHHGPMKKAVEDFLLMQLIFLSSTVPGNLAAAGARLRQERAT